MRKIYTISLVVLLTASMFAQAPQKMSYQSVIRNNSNALVTSSPVGMRISILKGSATGTPVYVETQTPTTNSNGLITIEIGGGTVVTGTFAAIDWSAGSYFIKTETAIAAPLTTYTITGTSQLLSVPYAFYSKTSEYITNVTVSLTGDTMCLGTNKIIVPGISAANQLKDFDGNVYKTVKIGNQVWMKENLKTTKYNDGTTIPNIAVVATWTAATTGAYCDYSNTPANSTTYGRLYNWYAVDNNAATKVASNGGKNVCPTGWHVPTDSEWTTLTDYCGGESVAGGKLKETGTSHWVSPNYGATNETGFTALPGGTRSGVDGTYFHIGDGGYWWRSTEYSTANAWGGSMGR